MLGTESGVSITDFDGRAELKTRAYLATHPEADFWEVYEHVLNRYEGNLVENTISPRVFECVAHRTAMVLFPGEYSKALQPWAHYIPLQKDFSNIEEVVTKLRDLDFLNAMTQRAYCDLIESGRYSYQVMIKEFDKAVAEHMQSVNIVSHSKKRFELAQRERLLLLSLIRLFGPLFKKICFFSLHPLAVIERILNLILPRPIYDSVADFYRKRFRDRHVS
jgi:hypothetical protein